MKAIYIIGLLAFITGCTSYDTQITKPLPTKLNKDYPVKIYLPENGRYDQINYKNSGQMTADALKTAFKYHASNVTIVTNTMQPGTEAYFIKPELLHWEDRATEWSGRRDHITIQITIFDEKTKTLKTSTIIRGASSWFTFGGDHPQDLLQKPINDYVNTLYN
jgi:hypothetical protein